MTAAHLDFVGPMGVCSRFKSKSLDIGQGGSVGPCGRAVCVQANQASQPCMYHTQRGFQGSVSACWTNITTSDGTPTGRREAAEQNSMIVLMLTLSHSQSSIPKFLVPPYFSPCNSVFYGVAPTRFVNNRNEPPTSHLMAPSRDTRLSYTQCACRSYVQQIPVPNIPTKSQ